MVARLLSYYQERTIITKNQFILKVVRVKAALVWPPVSNGYIPFSLSHEGNLMRKALIAEIWAMVTNEADSFAPGSSFYYNLFLMMKLGGGCQPVINLKPLNQFLHNLHFKMETSRAIIKAVSPSDWSVSIDLTDLYFHVPIHLEHQHFLCFLYLHRKLTSSRLYPLASVLPLRSS